VDTTNLAIGRPCALAAFFSSALFLSSTAFVEAVTNSGLAPTPRTTLNSVAFFPSEPRAPGPASEPIFVGPPTHSLSRFFPTPGNQGSAPTCAVWAVAYSLMTFELAVKEGISGKAVTPFSPAYLQHQISGRVDNGVTLADALEALRTKGTVPLSIWGDSTESFIQPLPHKLLKHVHPVKIKDFFQLELGSPTHIINGIKEQLLHNHPVIIAALVDDTFGEIDNTPTVISSLADRHHWHALVITGYSDAGYSHSRTPGDFSAGEFQFINTYGPTWNDHGFGYITYGVFSTVSPLEHYVVNF
jgi:C1A family cysteine protease